MNRIGRKDITECGLWQTRVDTVCALCCAAQTKFRYHVRVLIPCYQESQELVAATVQAAYNAKMPAGCQKTIYLCDDGKDKNKRKWWGFEP